MTFYDKCCFRVVWHPNTIKSAIPQRQTDEWCRITCRPGSANYFKYKILTAEISGKICLFFSFLKQIYFGYYSLNCCLFYQARHLRRWDQVCRQYFLASHPRYKSWPIKRLRFFKKKIKKGEPKFQPTKLTVV